jgi:cobalt-zinc-cadmium efflux system protein
MAHDHTPNLSRSTVYRLALSLGITLVFVVVEILSGVIANSMPLLADAAHIVTEDVTVSVGSKVQAAVGQMLTDRHEVRHATL